MQEREILIAAEALAREVHAGDASGHDWWHVNRVVRMARRLAEEEHADAFIAELAAWLHDIADDKLTGDEAAGVARLRDWLAAQQVAPDTVMRVMDIITTMSFGGGGRAPVATLEGQIVQDADRLDAIGAIGIARAFAYGGSRGLPLHEPGVEPRHYASKAEYHSTKSSTINHFHEKLLLLRDQMNTATARRLAAQRHQVMEQFLNEFAAEWEGDR